MDWFPRMRAMSLVSNEGGSEQNEVGTCRRSRSTMSLVKQLSGQLAELKEQVGALRRWSWVVGVGSEVVMGNLSPL